MGKVSVSLSHPIFEQLGAWVKGFNANPSVVTEAALRAFNEVPYAKQERLVREVFATKRVRNRAGWLGLFWDAYAEEFGAVNFGADNERYLMAVRQYDGFDTAILLLQRPNEENDRDVVLQVQESPPVVAGIETLTQRFGFTIDVSPISAASEVARWVHEQQPRATELREVRRKATGM